MGRKRKLPKLARLVFDRTRNEPWVYRRADVHRPGLVGSRAVYVIKIVAASPPLEVAGREIRLRLTRPRIYAWWPSVEVEVLVDGRLTLPGGKYTLYYGWGCWERRFMLQVHIPEGDDPFKAAPEDRNDLIEILEQQANPERVEAQPEEGRLSLP